MNYYEEESYSSFNIKPWLKLRKFFKPYTRKLQGLILFMLITALMDLSIPLFQKYAVDSFIAKDTTEGISSFIALYSAALVTMAVSVTAFIRQAVVVEMHIGMDLRKEIFEHLQNLSLSYYNTTPVGFILTRTLSDTNKIGSMIAWGLVDVFWSFAYVIGAFIAMLMLNVRLTLIVAMVIPVMAVVTVYFQKKILFTSRKLRKVNSKMTGSFNEGITGAKTSKTLVIEDKNLMEFKNISSEMKLSNVELNHEFIRKVLPKGSSFDNLEQGDINLMMSHINSYSRAKLNDKSPHQLFYFLYGQGILEKLGLKIIPPNEIILKPSLLNK